MKLYNTRSKKIEAVKPQSEAGLTIYSCGPTVYNYAHIGNLSSYIYADTLRRVAKLSGHNPTHVMNYTDVDDKTIRTSLENYPEDTPRDALHKLTDLYIEAFRRDMELIGNDLSAIQFVRATDFIDEMQILIKELHEQKIAYVTEDGVYFSIDAYKSKSKTYGQLLELTADNTSSERIQNDEYDKESIHDFALWKKQKDNEPAWDFEIDGNNLAGRPGWHIECSAMIRKSLGQPIDIHTGGIDLVFPHHENEIAQSTATTENPVLAEIFVHNEHLLVDGKKMSKSLGNFYTLRDIIEAGFDPLAFRLMVLQSHYRKRTDFTWDNLQAAQNRLNDLRAWADLRYQPSVDTMSDELDKLFRDTRSSMLQAAQEDINSSAALTALSKLVSYMQTIAIPGVEGTYTDGTLQQIDDLLGLNLASRTDITYSQKELIKNRDTARSNTEWEKADEFRDQLIAQGIGLRDTDFGTVWYRL